MARNAVNKLTRGYAENMRLLSRLLMLAIRAKDIETARDICSEIAGNAQACRESLTIEAIATANAEAPPQKRRGRPPKSKSKTP